jgi:serine/threonine-protein kinase
MGQVWAATHTITGRSLALKFVRDPQRFSPDAKRRFVREARAAASVRHPNVVDVLDVVETDEGLPVLVMERLFGETLARKVAREGALPIERVARIMLPVVEAVGTAHAAGIVHRDLKPDNIFLTDGGEAPLVKVLDFGIAKLIPQSPETLESALTTTGAILGTPYYMAPEQCFGERDVDHRVDVWALGVVLYECLAGKRPLEGENFGQILKLITKDDIAPLENFAPATPSDVLECVGRMLSMDRHARPQDLREVYAVLGKLLGLPSGAPPFGPARPPPEPSQTRLPDVTESKPTARVVLSGESVDPVSTTENQPPSGPTLALSEPRPAPSGRPRAVVTSVAAVFTMSVLVFGWWWRSSHRSVADRSGPDAPRAVLSSRAPDSVTPPPASEAKPNPAAPPSPLVEATAVVVPEAPRQTVAGARQPRAIPVLPRETPPLATAGTVSREPASPGPGVSATASAPRAPKGLIENPLF